MMGFFNKKEDSGIIEVTYNGNKHQTYIDVYKKVSNVCIKNTEGLTE